jgi:ribose transport system permease protein
MDKPGRLTTVDEKSMPNKSKSAASRIHLSNDLILVTILVVLIAVIYFLNPLFLSLSNIRTLIVGVALEGCLILGMTFVILTGGIDLSIGGIMAMAAVMSARALELGANWLVAWIMCIGIGAFVGLLNGVLIAKTRMPPLIVTLATMTITRGIAILVKGGYSIMIANERFTSISGNINIGVFSLSIPFVIFVVLFLICTIVLRDTTFGVAVYAIGSNREGAILSGIKADRVLIIIYTLMGVFSGLSALFAGAYVASAQPNMGIGSELSIISAVVLGGVSLFGGTGKIYLAVCGYLTIAVLVNGLTLLGVGSDIQYVIRGVVLLGAVFLSMTLIKGSRNR